MKPGLKLTVTLGLLALLGGLGAADYYFSGNEYLGKVTLQENEPVQNEPIVVPAGAVAKNNGPEVETVATQVGVQTKKGNDPTLISQVATEGTTINSLTILDNGDRAGSVTWIESGEVKTMFNALKEALLTAFSPQMTDLRDETIQEAAKPVRNILTFKDPGLSDEKILFIRVRERLYEFHITEGKEDVINGFAEALTAQ